ncbi:Histidine kinase [Catalinimonas alkaloidigena]|uniref:Histidine kinase n=1 Tax=Catalinimonas alkaloidigena TaxID=1075417 RepID=A0A1G9T861_9BACT|nr:histidine kinase [Catalinimonas alkaloidigena]SDM43854.1 Histidine kinase [Catalinimonas alkaloidigena]
MRLTRPTLYWISQLVGWSLYGAIGLFFTAAFNGLTLKMVLSQGVITGTMLLTSHLLRHLLRRWGWLRLRPVPLLVRLPPLLLGLAVASLAVMVFVLVAVLHLYIWSDYNLFSLGGYALSTFMVYCWWTLLYFIIHVFEDRQRQEVEKWKLQAAVNEAELTALKSQLNPHFVFNSLNNIRALVLEDPHRAREMITHLSTLLRYTIQFNNQDRVPLKRELEVVQDYLTLESIHYEKRLRYQIEADPATLEVAVPPMTVQLLVENAIKHGIANRPQGGEVRVRTFRSGPLLEIEVQNSGQLESASAGTGIGLRNAAERLRLLFGEITEFTLENGSPDTVAARFRIPVA